MVSKVFTAAPIGTGAVIIEVETSVLNGLPATNIVGLPDTAVKESRERVRSAIKSIGAEYPQTRVSVNLAPADIQKKGAQYDLPIALSILAFSSNLVLDLSGKAFFGELSLDGRLRPVAGVLSMVMEAKEKGFKKVFIPEENSFEASLVKGIEIFPVTSLASLIQYLSGNIVISPLEPFVWSNDQTNQNPKVDFSDIKGQSSAKRALEVAMAGGHNLLMYGSPGSGKSMLASALPGILPPLEEEELIELMKIYGATSSSFNKSSNLRPIRSPHHTASYASLVGGTQEASPGEITLAHKGVLFLDELPEFSRHVLESLRQPLESGTVTVARSKNTITWPADFTLVAAMNPCPCGNYGDSKLQCICPISKVQSYNRKISGPLLDRIDLRVAVNRMSYEEVRVKDEGERSSIVRERVINARLIQKNRFGTSRTNSSMTVKEIEKYAKVDSSGDELIRKAADKYNLSARSIHRVLKVARTIADLAKADSITKLHIAEAIQYRIPTT